MSQRDPGHWQFRPLNPNETSGASTTDDNFADEERTSVEILVRETLQNPLDARRDQGVVRVEYRITTVELSRSAFSQSIFSDDCVAHFRAGNLLNEKPALMTFLVVEDFGTTGLEGCFDDSSVDGRTENWNAFWFREGEGAKPSRSNGGAGQGKITLYLASRLRSVFALTRRASDGVELLAGCCRFRRNYKLPGDTRRWAKEARWGSECNPDRQAKPILEAALIEAAKAELQLRRHDHAGTSFIVPMPLEEISETSLLEAVVNEFFFAIRRGRLVVKVGDVSLDASSITAVADGMGEKCRLPKAFRAFLAATAASVDGDVVARAKARWTRDSKLNEAAFEPEALRELRSRFEASQLVAVDFPLTVRSREPDEASTSCFRVFLQQDEFSQQSHELFVRQDLGIDGEKRLRSARTIVPVMALTFIDDPRLSDLLVAAEEPTHRNWNAKRPKVVAAYFSPGDVLNAVRNAALRLVQLISPAGKRDDTALALYFNDPSSEGKRSPGSHGVKPHPGEPPRPPEVPPAKPKPVTVRLLKDGFELRSKLVEHVSFPVRCKVALAYATAVGNPFRLWDAADFWVSDDAAHPKEHSGISGLSTDLNLLQFQVDREDAYLKVTGFDNKRQLVIRVKYEEVSGGADNENN